MELFCAQTKTAARGAAVFLSSQRPILSGLVLAAAQSSRTEEAGTEQAHGEGSGVGVSSALSLAVMAA